jgi:biotin-[acetyl-CoA-carboxylase] ligase BirA-like protein
MKIYTDKIEFANRYFSGISNWRRMDIFEMPDGLKSLSERLLRKSSFYYAETESNMIWNHVFAVEFSEGSQYDILNSISSENDSELPDGILCLAGAGKKFHGWRNRAWESLQGNLHLSVYLKPQCSIEHFSAGFMALPAVSVMETIDSLQGMQGKAGVKWVNDINIDGHKVCGFIAQSQLRGSSISSAILGIGLNIMSKPELNSDKYIANATCLYDYVNDELLCSEEIVFNRLINNLDKHYKVLLNKGYKELLDIYRDRSIVIGKEISIYSDSYDDCETLLHSGKAISIGDDLELYIDGVSTPIISGRLAIHQP